MAGVKVEGEKGNCPPTTGLEAPCWGLGGPALWPFPTFFSRKMGFYPKMPLLGIERGPAPGEGCPRAWLPPSHAI